MSPVCRVHGAIAQGACTDCRLFAAEINSHGYPEAPWFEDWSDGVEDALDRIERGATPAEIRAWVAERRGGLRQQGLAA